MFLLVFYHCVCSYIQDARGGGGHSREVQVEMYHRGLQTLRLCLTQKEFILLLMLKKRDVLYNPFLSCVNIRTCKNWEKKKDQEEKKDTNKAELALFQKQTVRGRGGKDFSLSTPSPKVEVLNWN